MKYVYLCSVLLLVHLNLKGQTFAPIGAEWIMGYIEPMTNVEHSYRTLTVVGDTVINGKTSQIILGDAGPHSPSLTNENYVYEVGGEVYAYFDQINQFQKVFDFDKSAGYFWDLVIHEAPTNAVFNGMRITIDSTFIEFLDGVSTKSYTYSIEFLPNEGSQCPELYDSTMMSAYDLKANNKLGAGHYLFPVPTLLCVADIYSYEWMAQLRCYTDLTMTYTHLGIGIPHCNYENISVIELDNKSPYLEYDNNFKTIKVNASNQLGGTLKIYNFQGQLLINKKGEWADVSGLRMGIYIAKYTTHTEEVNLKFKL